MFISAIDNRTKKMIFAYTALAVFTAVFAQVYMLFGHGVRSKVMAWAFMFPLFLGAVYYLIWGRVFAWLYQPPKARVWQNIYNAGVATITCAALLQGVLEIAGAASVYLPVFYILGAVLCLAPAPFLWRRTKQRPKPAVNRFHW